MAFEVEKIADVGKSIKKKPIILIGGVVVIVGLIFFLKKQQAASTSTEYSGYDTAMSGTGGGTSAAGLTYTDVNSMLTESNKTLVDLIEQTNDDTLTTVGSSLATYAAQEAGVFADLQNSITQNNNVIANRFSQLEVNDNALANKLSQIASTPSQPQVVYMPPQRSSYNPPQEYTSNSGGSTATQTAVTQTKSVAQQLADLQVQYGTYHQQFDTANGSQKLTSEQSQVLRDIHNEANAIRIANGLPTT